MMTWLRRLRREEKGQVLYLTLVMMLVLVMFSLVLVNVIYLGAMKVKAQHAADNMALSAATLKAKLLNTATNINGANFLFALQIGTIPYRPYFCIADCVICALVNYGLFIWFLTSVVEYNCQWDDLKRIAQENGIDEQHSKVRMFPHLITNLDFAMSTADENQKATYITTYYPVVVTTTSPLTLMPTSFEPANLDKAWYVQSRVEWQTKDMLIGGKWLGVTLPDMVTRARAEIYDEATLPLPWTHIWKVRLTQPKDNVDDYIKNSSFIW